MLTNLSGAEDQMTGFVDEGRSVDAIHRAEFRTWSATIFLYPNWDIRLYA